MVQANFKNMLIWKYHYQSTYTTDHALIEIVGLYLASNPGLPHPDFISDSPNRESLDLHVARLYL